MGSRSRSRSRSKEKTRADSRDRASRSKEKRSRSRSRSRDRRRRSRSRDRRRRRSRSGSRGRGGFNRYSDQYWKEQGGPEYRIARDGTVYYYSERNGRPFEIRPGDWTCTRCKQNNFMRNRECYRCREMKGNAELTMDVCRREGIKDKSHSPERRRSRRSYSRSRSSSRRRSRSRSSTSRSRSRSPKKSRSDRDAGRRTSGAEEVIAN